MSIESFWISTIREIRNILKGAYDRQFDLIKSEWENNRWQTMHLLNIHIVQEERYEDVHDLMIFPWEGDVLVEREKLQEKKWEEELERREAAKETFKKWDAHNQRELENAKHRDDKS